MNACVHKLLLLSLARGHAAELRTSYHLARAQLGEGHHQVGQLRVAMDQADACVRSLECELGAAA